MILAPEDQKKNSTIFEDSDITIELQYGTVVGFYIMM